VNSKATAARAPAARAGIGHNQPPDEFLSDTALAQRLNVSDAHVWHMAAREIIPQPYKLGKAARWNWPEVLAALKATQTGPDERAVRRLTEGRHAARARKANAGGADFKSAG
jgi:predicted DNA-binding transcriptional regulator AlpA